MPVFGQSPIWITGLGFVSSLGHSVERVTQRLREGKTGLRVFDWDAERETPVSLAGPLEGFETSSGICTRWKWPEEYNIPKRLLRSLPPHGLYGLIALTQAFAESRWDEETIASTETGFYSASAGSPQMMLHHLGPIRDAESWASHPSAIVSSSSGTLNFTLASHFGIRGANLGFVSACASSAHAIGYAIDDLQRGRIQRAVILGAEDFAAITTLPFAGLRALSCHTDPRQVSPFDVGRDGFVGTGGAVALCLERGDAPISTPYARLLGWGQSADGGSVTQPEPNGAGLALAIERALAETGLEKRAIDYVNAHATATPVGDLAEGRALRTIFAKHLDHLQISSTKHLTGHPLSMAGALEAALCAIMLREGFIAGNDHLENVEPELADLPLPKKAQQSAPKIVLSNSSGFGGSNVVLAMARA